MNKLLQNKVLLAVVAGAVILIVGGFLIFSRKSASNTVDTSPQAQVLTLSTKDFGMVTTLRDDKKAVMFEITKPTGIVHVEYQITYTKDVNGEQVPEGIYGEMNIAKDGITKTDFREFGTCSSGKCRYDKVISDVKIILKIQKDDGKTYSAEETVKLK